MSEKNHFVLWKGVQSGPFTKEQLENEFVDGKMGLVRTVIINGNSIPARDFVSGVQTVRREDELAAQLKSQEHQAEAARKALAVQQEKHRIDLEEASRRPAGKTTPPPIPDVNPWAPRSAGGGAAPVPARHSGQGSSVLSESIANTLLVLGYLFAVAALFSGHLFREAFGILSVGMGITLALRSRLAAGIILAAVALCCYGAGYLLTDLIHDHILKNYPH